MTVVGSKGPSAWRRWLREPLLHFFVAGGLLFGLRGFLSEDPHLIVVTPGLRAELNRRFQDERGRPPNEEEAAAALRTWKHEEAVFREGLRRQVEKDDPGVRAAVIHKMQAIASLQTPEPRPTEADLSAWLEAQRSVYELPLRYDFEFLTFHRGQAGTEAALEETERTLASGAPPRTLGRPLKGGKLAAAELESRLEPELAARIPSLPQGPWQRVDGAEVVWLVRVKGTLGGLPTIEALRPRLITDWTQAKRQEAADAALLRELSAYRYEEQK